MPRAVCMVRKDKRRPKAVTSGYPGGVSQAGSAGYTSAADRETEYREQAQQADRTPLLRQGDLLVPGNLCPINS